MHCFVQSFKPKIDYHVRKEREVVRLTSFFECLSLQFVITQQPRRTDDYLKGALGHSTRASK